jgi:hypothetical protein
VEDGLVNFGIVVGGRRVQPIVDVILWLIGNIDAILVIIQAVEMTRVGWKESVA